MQVTIARISRWLDPVYDEAMGSRPSWVCLSIGLLLPGCGTVKGDLETMCNMSTVCPPRQDLDPSERAMDQAACLTKKIRTSEGEKTFAALASVAPGDRPRLMRDAAKEAGVMACPEADALEKRLEPTAPASSSGGR